MLGYLWNALCVREPRTLEDHPPGLHPNAPQLLKDAARAFTSNNLDELHEKYRFLENTLTARVFTPRDQGFATVLKNRLGAKISELEAKKSKPSQAQVIPLRPPRIERSKSIQSPGLPLPVCVLPVIIPARYPSEASPPAKPHLTSEPG